MLSAQTPRPPDPAADRPSRLARPPDARAATPLGPATLPDAPPDLAAPKVTTQGGVQRWTESRRCGRPAHRRRRLAVRPRLGSSPMEPRGQARRRSASPPIRPRVRRAQVARGRSARVRRALARTPAPPEARRHPSLRRLQAQPSRDSTRPERRVEDRRGACGGRSGSPRASLGARAPRSRAFGCVDPDASRTPPSVRRRSRRGCGRRGRSGPRIPAGLTAHRGRTRR